MDWVKEVNFGSGREFYTGFMFMKSLKFSHLRLCANKVIMWLWRHSDKIKA